LSTSKLYWCSGYQLIPFIFSGRLQQYQCLDHFCGLVVRVAGCRSRGPEFDSQCYQIFWDIVGLKLGPLSNMFVTEPLLVRQSSGSSIENQD
jgi:hypothetical protein